MYHYFDPHYFVPTLRIFWEMSWCPGTLSVQVEECQDKNVCMFWNRQLCAMEKALWSQTGFHPLKYLTKLADLG